MTGLGSVESPRRQALQKSKPRPCVACEQATEVFVLEVMVQLTKGVAHMHKCKVLHRDLKADNALIQSLEPLVIKWADFGCAVQVGSCPYGDGTALSIDHVHQTPACLS